jgi:hypothetical protein
MILCSKRLSNLLPALLAAGLALLALRLAAVAAGLAPGATAATGLGGDCGTGSRGVSGGHSGFYLERRSFLQGRLTEGQHC